MKQGDEELPICGNCLRAKRYCDRSKEVKFRHRSSTQTSQEVIIDDPSVALQDPDIASKFQHYIKDLAPWYDLSDGNASFAKIVPLVALKNPLLFNAIIAFAAIHLNRTRTPHAAPTATKFHANCVKLLISLKEEDIHHETGISLAAVCLLRSYEILAEDFDPNRHLSGAYAIAIKHSLDSYEPTLAQAGFFNYLREDITYSLINVCPLKIDLSSTVLRDVARDDEDQLNVASLFLANAINTVFGENAALKSVDEAFQRFSDWRAALPIQFTPYFESGTEPGTQGLPILRVLRDCHASVIQYCLVTKCVIQYMKPLNEESALEQEFDALRICGLAFTSQSPAVVVNSFGPISFACRCLRKESHQMELIRRLQSCVKETGWPVQRMIDNLEQHWAQKS